MSEADRSQPLVESIPKDDPSPDSIDALLSSELYTLSLEERAQVLEDVHGVSNEIDEDPEFVSESLDKLEKKLETTRNKQDYDYAYALDPQYVKNRELRLRFLRSTSFDISTAASRIVKHFEAKMELFGKANVAKDITQDDLSKEDLECLYCGYNQILPVRDQAGRGVMLGLPHLTSNLDVKHKLRSLYYSVMVLTENEEIQKKGVVAIVYLVGSQIDRQAAWAEPRLMSSMPVLEKSIHICYNNPFIRPIVTLAQFALGTLSRVRTRLHYGTFDTCVHGMKSFGIPTYALPFDENGNPTSEEHKLYWEKRRQHERRSRGQGKTVFPGPFDVLVGRGRLCQDHIGNVRYRILVEKYKEEYDEASNFDKTAMAFMIITMVKEATGRFLKDGGDGWVEVDDNKVRAKVSHSFRTLRYCNNASKLRGGGSS